MVRNNHFFYKKVLTIKKTFDIIKKTKEQEGFKMRICFDMDGTLANLYNVENWLDKLMNNDPSPYAEAAVMVNMNSLARLLNKLQKKGFEIGIISWLSKNSNIDYDNKVIEAKKAWLKKHLKSVRFNFIEIVAYGTNKNIVRKETCDILFDDEENNRKNWKGVAYNVNNILETLRKLT